MPTQAVKKAHKRISDYFGWRRVQIWMALLAVAGALLCFVPLLNLLGYEFSLVIAALSSLAAGHIAAAYPSRVREQLAPFPGARFTIARLYLVVLAIGFGLLAAPLALISLNALRVRNCDFLEGSAFFLLGPIASVAVASAYGLAAGLATGSRRLASVLWVSIWLGAIAAELYEGWSTPSVRSLGSFHGYFSGVLYDEDVTVPAALLTYRLRDLAELTTILLLCSWLIDRSELRLRPRVGWAGRRRLLPPLTTALVVAAGFVAAPWLGHRRTAEDVSSSLGGHTTSGRCVVHHPLSLEAKVARALARDCEFRLHQVERYFAVTSQEPLTVFLFEDPEQKQELMGAGHTSVAKPWRREVYIQRSSFPHPVLKHEIAHIVAGDFGARPLRVAGQLGGVLASPGLIEGAAVAAAWNEDELTPHQWSRAMRELEVAPPIGDILGLRFMSLNASRAYVLAGSFSRFLLEAHGAERYRKAYGTADLPGAYGQTVAELEHEWIEFLQKIPLRRGDLELARDRFVQPAVFGKVCAHEVAQLRRRALSCEASGLWQQSAELRRLVERYSASDGRSRFELARTLLSAGKQARSNQLLGALARDDTSPRLYRRAARELQADISWVAGRRREALSTYRQLANEPALEASSRLLTVKIAALEDEELEPYLRRFLLGGQNAGPEAADLSLLTLSELTAALPDEALGHYLLGRQLFLRDEDQRALEYLQRARRLKLSTPALRAENLRLVAIAQLRLGQIERARALFEQLARDEERPLGAREEARDWLERCDWELAERGTRGATARPDGA